QPPASGERLPVQERAAAQPPRRGFLYALAFSSDGKTLLTGGSGGEVYVFNRDSGVWVSTFWNKTAAVTARSCTPAGDRVGIVTADGRAQVSVMSPGGKDQYLEGLSGYGLDVLAFSADGKLVAAAAGEESKEVRVWQAAGDWRPYATIRGI